MPCRFVAGRSIARYPPGVQIRRWMLGVLVIAGLGAAVPLAHEWYRSFAPKLGPLVVSPAPTQVSVRVGESVRFTAAADGAVGYQWLVWGRPVSSAPSWSYTPAPEDAGWQQVSIEVTGRKGLRASRTWDVGVVKPVLPEIDALDPPPGSLALPPRASATFRARAHLPAARTSDRLVFEWTLDDRPILREEQPAEQAASEVVLPGAVAGAHRLRLRVTEDGRTASLADWTIDAAPAPTRVVNVAPEERAAPAVPTVEPVPVDAPEPPPAAPSQPAPRLVRAPGARQIETQSGTPVVFETHVEPVDAPVTYRWSVDGKQVAGKGGRLQYVMWTTGHRRVALTVALNDKTLGTDAWEVDVHPMGPSTPTARNLPELAPLPEMAVVRVPADHELEGELGRVLVLEARVDDAPVAYHWSIDGQPVRAEPDGRLAWEPARPGLHTVAVAIKGDRGAALHESWKVAVHAPERAAPPAPPEPAPRLAPTAPATLVPPEPVPIARAMPSAATARQALDEADVRRWLAEYARAWSRKDVGALRRMGQVRSAAEAERLEQYFHSVDELDVDVRVLKLSVAGERASVEFERVDTVTDPSGRRQQLRMPPIRKEIERTPDGLRFSAQAGAG